MQLPKARVKPHRWWSLKDRRKAKDVEKLVNYKMKQAKDEIVTELATELGRRLGL